MKHLINFIQINLQKIQLFCYPYMKYAQNLYVKPEDFYSHFCYSNSPKYTMEDPHNQYHGSLGVLMRSVPVAALNLLFWAYHSFIDLMLQIKIQWINHNKHPNQIHFQEGPKKAVNGIQKKLDSNLGTGRIQSLWNTYFKNKFKKQAKNKDYPIFIWIKPLVSGELKQGDFIQGKKTFQDLMILRAGKNFRLKELKQSVGSVYDVNYTDFSQQNPFFNNLAKLMTIVGSPYPQKFLVKTAKQSSFSFDGQSDLQTEICLEVVYRSSLTSRKCEIVVIDGHLNLLGEHSNYIFTRGDLASQCPRCQQYSYFQLLTSPNNAQNKFGQKIDLRKLTKQIVGQTVIYKPAYLLEQNIFWKSNDENYLISHKIGRQRVLVRLLDRHPASKAHVLAKFISNGAAKLEEGLIYQKFDFQSKQSEIIIQKNDYYVSSLQVIQEDQNGRYVTKYKFPLYAEYCQLQFSSRSHSLSNKESSFEVQNLVVEKRISLIK